MISLIVFFSIGAAAGVITGIPLGPVNVAVINAAYRHHFRRALAVGLGGATADLLYAFLGVKGFGPLIEQYPRVKGIVLTVCGLLLLVYGFITARAEPVDPTVEEKERRGGYFWGGFGLGFRLILINPGALVAWGVMLGTHAADAAPAEGTALAVGVGVGSAAWFTFVAWAADHGKRMLGKNAVWISRIVGTVLIIGGLWFTGRGIYTLMAA